jgi:hypothetical protein
MRWLCRGELNLTGKRIFCPVHYFVFTPFLSELTQLIFQVPTGRFHAEPMICIVGRGFAPRDSASQRDASVVICHLENAHS